MYRLLTSLTSLTSLTPKNISQKWVFTVLVYVGLNRYFYFRLCGKTEKLKVLFWYFTQIALSLQMNSNGKSMSYTELAQLELMNAAANVTSQADLDALRLTLSLFFAGRAQQAIDKTNLTRH